MKSSENDSQKEKYINLEMEQTSLQLESSEQALQKLKEQNGKLEQEVEELESQMKQVFGEDVLKAKKKNKIDYNNIVNSDVNQKV